MQKIKCYLALIFLIFSTNIKSEINEEFINLFVNELPCSDAFIEYIHNDNLLKNDFSFNINEVEILKKIFMGFCSKDLVNDINAISKKIFSINSDNVSLLYAIHTSKFQYHLINERPIKILEIMIKELELINSINPKILGSTYDIANIIENLSLGVESFDISEFNENYINDMNFAQITNRMYTLVEQFIFNAIDDDFNEENLISIGNTLFSIRIAKSNNLNYYGSPLERYSARDQIIKIYLSNYKDGYIKYHELNTLINLENNNREEYISLKPSFDQILNLNYIETSYDINGYGDIGYKNKSDKIFDTTVQEMLSHNFNEYPEEVINNITLRLFRQYKNTKCFLMDESFIPNPKSIDSSLIELKFVAYKLACKNENKYVSNLIKNLEIFYTKLNKENFLPEKKESYLIDANLLSMFLDLYLSNNPQLFSKKNISEYISLKKVQIGLLNTNMIGSFEDYMPILNFTQSSSLVDSFVTPGSQESIYIKSLSNSLIDKVKLDTEFIRKSLLSKEIDKTEKINFSRMLTFHSLNLMNSISVFTPEYLSIFIQDLKQSKMTLRYEQLMQSMEMISFYIDNIEEIYIQTSPEFIFSIQPLDQWLILKDLLSIEVFLNYALLEIGDISYEQYFEIGHKRINQLISLRPEKISLEKFKSIYIENNTDLDFNRIIKKYDQIQKEYRELLESKIILTKDIYDISAADLSSIELSYVNELTQLQKELFDHEKSNELFSHDVINTIDIAQSLNKNEAIFSFIAGSFFSTGVVIENNRAFMYPLELSTTNFLELSKTIKTSFSDPNSAIPYNKLEELYEIFFSDLLHKKNNIYIVTDEVFSGFPFHALKNKKSKNWTIDDSAITYLSGEKLLLYLDRKKLNKQNRFIGFGNPSLNKNILEKQIDSFFSERGDFKLQNISDLYELPDTEEELNNVSKYFNNSKLYFQENATEENLINTLESAYDYIAIATHSVKGISNFYNDRGLVLTPINKENNNNDGFLSNQEIKSLNLLNSPIVIMTACNTIEPQYYQSLPYSGLASSFMEAGASGVLLSLWNVNSQSSSDLNQLIFSELNDNKYFDQAFTNSIISLKNNQNYSHPYYWAPYIFLGK